MFNLTVIEKDYQKDDRKANSKEEQYSFRRVYQSNRPDVIQLYW